MRKNLLLVPALLAGLFAAAPSANAAPLAVSPAVAEGANADVTAVRYGYGYGGYGHRRHFGPRFGYGYGPRRHFGHRFGYGPRHFGHRHGYGRGFRYGY